MAKIVAFIILALALVALSLADVKKVDDLQAEAGHHHGHHHGWGHTQHYGWGWGWPHYDFGYKFRAGWGHHHGHH